MNKKIKMALYIVLALIIIMACLSVWYVNDYSHADASVNAYLNGTENVSVEKVENGLFLARVLERKLKTISNEYGSNSTKYGKRERRD